MSDCHFPYQNQEYVDRACLETKNLKPDAIVIDGDLLDFPLLSKYAPNPILSEISLDAQIAQAWSFLSDLRAENPQAKIYFIEGNHDYRMRAYVIRETIKLDNGIKEKIVRYVDLEKELKLKPLKINFIRTRTEASRWTDTYMELGGIVIGHFDTVSNPIIPAGMTVRQIMSKKIKGKSVVQGHVHRAAIVWDKNEEDEMRFGVENPALCKRPNYSELYNWAFGYTILEKTSGGWRPEVKIF